MSLIVGMALRFCSFVARVRKFWGLIPAFVEVTGENLVAFFCPPSWIGLISFIYRNKLSYRMLFIIMTFSGLNVILKSFFLLFHFKISCQQYINFWLIMMSGHGANSVFFNTKLKIWRHICITPKGILLLLKLQAQGVPL